MIKLTPVDEAFDVNTTFSCPVDKFIRFKND
jgi:hypothetical protein